MINVFILLSFSLFKSKDDILLNLVPIQYCTCTLAKHLPSNANSETTRSLKMIYEGLATNKCGAFITREPLAGFWPQVV